MHHERNSNGCRVWAALLLLATSLAVADGVGPPPLATFQKGEARLKWNGKPYALRLANGRLHANSSTTLVYAWESENPGGSPGSADLRLELREVRAPGKYGNAQLAVVRLTLVEGVRVEDIAGKSEPQMVAMMEAALKTQRAEFDPKRSRCTVEVRRIGKAGVDGLLDCTGMGDGEGGVGPAIAGLHFSAGP